jgi:diguanylate cyclase (GGDEF)-like protein
MARPARQRTRDIVVTWPIGLVGTLSVDALLTGIVDSLPSLARCDDLTGLANRNGFMLAAERLADQQTDPITLILLDLDRFKDINDAFGHSAGDDLLRAVGTALRRYADGRGCAGRLGRDEFAVVVPDLERWRAGAEGYSRAVLTGIGERIQHAVRGPFTIAGVPVSVEVGVGIAYRSASGEDVSTLLRRAETAMRVAKRERTGVEVWHAELGMARSDDLRVLAHLRKAIPGGQLRLYYQPLIDAGTRRTHSVEALVRWQHPEWGMLPPGRFIPQAERSDVILALTDWVLDTALADVAGWMRTGHPLPVSVNVSAACLAQERLCTTVATLLAAHHVPGGLLTIEVTESAVMSHPQRAAARLTALRELGARVSVDDFGTGYTSLALLTQLPIDELKLDRSFVARVTDSASHRAVVRAVAEMARGLGVTLVGEGIEDEATAEALQVLGFDLLQGYHFGRPVPADTISGADHMPPALTGEVARVLAGARAATGGPSAAVARQVAMAGLPKPDTQQRQALNALAAVAAQLCGAPVGLVTLVRPDRVDVVGNSSPLRLSALARPGNACLYNVAEDGWFEVVDASVDPRFAEHHLVRVAGLRYYAGEPVRTPAGVAIGSLRAAAPRALAAPGDRRPGRGGRLPARRATAESTGAAPAHRRTARAVHRRPDAPRRAATRRPAVTGKDDPNRTSRRPALAAREERPSSACGGHPALVASTVSRMAAVRSHNSSNPGRTARPPARSFASAAARISSQRRATPTAPMVTLAACSEAAAASASCAVAALSASRSRSPRVGSSST